MAKELPYFKFEPNEWENGNIQMLSRQDKGLFIDLCSMYWSRLGDLPEKLAIMKICNGQKNAIDELLINNIISIENECIKIAFLDEQLSSFKSVSKVNSVNASSRWDNIPERIKGNLVYVIKCWNENEEFIKIGITDTSINRRFSGKIPYEYEAIVIDFYEDINLESQYSKIAKGCEYIPKKKFSGNTECFKTSIIPKIIEFANIRNAKYIRKECENDAIREDKIKEDKIKEDKNINSHSPINWESFLKFYNDIFGKKARSINDVTKKKFLKLLKDGYTKEDILKAMVTVKNDEFAKSKKYGYCIPLYFTRPDVIDRYAFPSQIKNKNNTYNGTL